MLFRYKNDANGKQIRQAIVYTEDEHKIKLKHVDQEAMHIINRLHSSGFDAYIVGGAVRDLLLGRPPKDFDIVTSAEPAKIRRIFRNSRIIGKRFRLVHVYFDSKIYEVATFRSNENGSVGNTFGSIEEDVRRRDFSINALYYDPLKNQVIDYVNGVRDLQKKKLSAVIPKKTIFLEDPVRMVRAIKYSIMTDCKIPLLLKLQIAGNASMLQYTSDSRITEEINKILKSAHSMPIMKALIRYHLIEYIQPNVCSFIEDIPDFSKSFFDSLQELDQLVAENKIKRQGQALVYLIRDFINLIANKNGLSQEVFSFVYKECRHFIMPMNPMRVELAYAVSICMQKLGFKSIKIPSKVRPRTKSKYIKRKNIRKKTSPVSRPSKQLE
ncbi:MAG: polynucleotide adenylyltransferase [Treponema sp.]|nr:MAG: polynucleotide adenylyltransferase [Treponema sp.]